MYIERKFFRYGAIRQLTGFHYLILCVLTNANVPLKRKQIVELLTSKAQKSCMNDKTLSKDIQELLQKGFIVYNNFNKKYALSEKKYNPQYIRYSSKAIKLIVDKAISSEDFRVYLCLMKNLQFGKSTLLEDLSINLGKGSDHNISRNMHKLEQVGLIQISKRLSKDKYWYNVYTPLYEIEEQEC